METWCFDQYFIPDNEANSYQFSREHQFKWYERDGVKGLEHMSRFFVPVNLFICD